MAVSANRMYMLQYQLSMLLLQAERPDVAMQHKWRQQLVGSSLVLGLVLGLLLVVQVTVCRRMK